MDLGLNGRVAIVAGASSGLGLAVARELAAEGAHVSLGARDRDRLQAAMEDVDRAGPGGVMATPLDVRDTEAVRDWVACTVEQLGGLGIVVANAGGPPSGRATAFTMAEYRDALELNLLSSICLVQAALPYLLEARLGVVGFAKSLVADLAERGASGITVNVLAPGTTRTPRMEQLGGLQDAASGIPLGRVAEPEEFAAAAAFLASARASFITGVTLPVDGGTIRGIF
jgi:3-oxoacyl-[acyl-carrier protein] reductase